VNETAGQFESVPFASVLRGDTLPEHVVFVHAHPDDETISTGGTIATLVDGGVGVTVLSCTRGERGEVIPAELKHLEGDEPALALYREGELAKAMEVLGVTDHRFLGEQGARLAGLLPRRYLDSGMQWGADGAETLERLDPGSLCAAPLGEVAADVATVIEASGATSVISYDAHGGYGHPDHIRTYDAARRAAEVLGIPFFAIVVPVEGSDVDPAAADGAGNDIVVDVSPVIGRKTDALRAHRTQVTVDGTRFALSSGPFREIATEEHFRRERRRREGRRREGQRRAATWSREGRHGAREEESTAWHELGRTSRVVACVLALLMGAALGGIGTVNHQWGYSAGFPLGVIAGLVLVAALVTGLRLVFATRIVAFFASVGILVSLVVLTVGGPGGSVLVPANGAGYGWSYGAAAIIAVVLAWPNLTGLHPAHLPQVPPATRDTMGTEPDTKGRTEL
jgi:N-acetyl-1-D-myo-inositol-2-amino-2-deoxy-alpha-D-glucopyranoside deacetylase